MLKNLRTIGSNLKFRVCMNLLDFHSSLHKFATADSIEELTELCRYYCEQLGFDYFIYALRVPTFFADSRLVLIN
ncbi:MAG: hypothetical protein FJ190_09400 [Gammaproteobacteria bacterium]|nr:hypothetical protein [Gammaproteobacteria bacterium]